MAIKSSDIPRIVIQRVASAHPRPAFFACSEIQEWPAPIPALFVRVGLLAETGKTGAILCTGCEWQCYKIPVIRRSYDGYERAYISCDEAPSFGRIQIPIETINHYQADLRTLSGCLAGLLGSDQPRPLPSGNAYTLGSIKGRYGKRSISTSVTSSLAEVIVGTQSEPIYKLLTCSISQIHIDQNALKRLANRKEHERSIKNISDKSRQQARKRQTNARNTKIFQEAKNLARQGMAWSDAARRIEGTDLAPGLSFERIRKIISEMRAAEL